MKQQCVEIGMQASVKIGSRLADVTVIRRLEGRGRARFECRTSDTGRIVKATAARLRPMPTPAVRAMAAARDEIVLAGIDAPAIDLAGELAAWAACPVGAW
jgi:hypothetical protein